MEFNELVSMVIQNKTVVPEAINGVERAEQSQLRKSKQVFDKFMKSKRKQKQIGK